MAQTDSTRAAHITLTDEGYFALVQDRRASERANTLRARAITVKGHARTWHDLNWRKLYASAVPLKTIIFPLYAAQR